MERHRLERDTSWDARMGHKFERHKLECDTSWNGKKARRTQARMLH